jgi:hypothetical protein
MDLGLIIKANIYWDSLSVDDRVKFLRENNFWEGFAPYLWSYIPNTLKELIMARIASNCV